MVTYGYDDAGRRTSMTLAGQPAITYGYDDANRFTSITQGTSVVGFEYDDGNRRTALALPNGVRVEYGYTATSQLAGLTYKLGTAVLGTVTYGYDAAGRRVEMSGTWARTTLPQSLTSVVYDDANRVTQWNGATLTYDDSGNLLTEGSRSYSWDARNRLTALGGLQPATFLYDGLGRRISRSTAAATTDYLYDGGEAVQESTGGSPTANLLYGPGSDELLLRTSGAVARWLVADGLGSALALIDPAGTVQTRYTYGAFGSTSATGEASDNVSQFTGRENDGTGLYYYRARYYSSRLQRFVSEDPIGFAGGDVNLYGYVSNDPIASVDPSGLGKIGGAIRVAKIIGERLIKGRQICMKDAQKIRRKEGNVIAPDRKTAREIHDGAFRNDSSAGRTLHHEAEKKGYYPHYQADKKKGHTFYPNSSSAAIPGANLGDMVGRKSGSPLLGGVIDFLNPLSDVQDVVNLLDWLTGG